MFPSLIWLCATTHAGAVLCFNHFMFRYKGGPALPRKLISQGDVNKQFNVEVFPLCLKIIDSRDNSLSVIKLSKKVLLSVLFLCISPFKIAVFCS